MGYLGLGESAEYAVIGGSFDRKCNNFLNIGDIHPKFASYMRVF